MPKKEALIFIDFYSQNGDRTTYFVLPDAMDELVDFMEEHVESLYDVENIAPLVNAYEKISKKQVH